MSEPERPATQRSLPAAARLGAAAIVSGVLLDLAEHSLAAAPGVAGTTSGQHAAHLVVLIGMVLVLLAIVRDGISRTGRPSRQEGRATHAVR